jgi:hypothetical protein
MNATPNTPALSNENPNCPGNIKSIVLYLLPGMSGCLSILALVVLSGKFISSARLITSPNCDCRIGNLSILADDVVVLNLY